MSEPDVYYFNETMLKIENDEAVLVGDSIRRKPIYGNAFEALARIADKPDLFSHVFGSLM